MLIPIKGYVNYDPEEGVSELYIENVGTIEIEGDEFLKETHALYEAKQEELKTEAQVTSKEVDGWL